MKSKAEKPAGHEQVMAFLETLEHPLKREIEALRTIILSASERLTEHIKWNAPSFCVEDEDRITFKLFPPKNIQLIFHRGAKVKEQPQDRLIADPHALLKWAANDRAVATFTHMDEIRSQEKALTEVIHKWLDATGSSK